MKTGQAVMPSKEARSLFNSMVVYSDHNLHLSVEQSFLLEVRNIRAGKRPPYKEVAELVNEEWIDPAPGGGWYLH